MAQSQLAWQRRPDETSRSWACFNTYLRLGPSRTLSQAANTAGHLHDTVRRWSSQHHWVLRAAAYDEHMQAVYTEQAEDTARAMADRHVRIAGLAQAVVARELQWVSSEQQRRDRALTEAAQAGTDPPPWALEQRMTMTAAARLLQVATQLERGATVQPTFEDELANLDNDQLREELALELGIPVDQVPEL